MLYYCIFLESLLWKSSSYWSSTMAPSKSQAALHLAEPHKKKLSKHQLFSKSDLSISTGWWECLCYVQNCQGSVRDNRYSLQHDKEMMGETKQRQKNCSTFRISQQKETDKGIPFSVTLAQAFLSSNLGKLQSIVLHQCQHHKLNHPVHCLKPVFFFFSSFFSPK